MRFVSKCGLSDRVLGVAGIAIALLAGCTGAPASDANSGNNTPASPPLVAENPTAASDAPVAANSDERVESQRDELIAADREEPVAADETPVIELAATTADAARPEQREAAKPIVAGYAADVPPVLLSAGHRKLCKVLVGDVLPTIELPKLDGGAANFESLAGAKATVVLFWTADAWMSETALRDLQRDVAGQFPSDKVGLIGVAVKVPADAAQKSLAAAGAKYPQLLDADGTALAQVGEDALPRVYVLDGQRRIAWFDIEYGESTRRELQQTLTALTAAAE